MKAIGIIEVVANVAAYACLDAMLKAADVSVVTAEKALGGRLVSIIIEGSTSDVKAALEHGKQAAESVGTVAAMVAINHPHDELKRVITESLNYKKVVQNGKS